MYSPSGEHAAAIASVMSATRPGASLQARATISWSTCTPSLMTSRVIPAQRMAASTGPGARGVHTVHAIEGMGQDCGAGAERGTRALVADVGVTDRHRDVGLDEPGHRLHPAG